jgi:hypothetical protein
MLPVFAWLWWRGAFSQATLRYLLLVAATLSLYFAVKDALWRDQSDWSFLVDVACILLLLCVAQPVYTRFGLVSRRG